MVIYILGEGSRAIQCPEQVQNDCNYKQRQNKAEQLYGLYLAYYHCCSRKLCLHFCGSFLLLFCFTISLSFPKTLAAMKSPNINWQNTDKIRAQNQTNQIKRILHCHARVHKEKVNEHMEIRHIP